MGGKLRITAKLQSQNAVLTQQVALIKKELEEVSQQNKMLAHDKWILGQEKAQLFGQLKQWESMVATG